MKNERNIELQSHVLKISVVGKNPHYTAPRKLVNETVGVKGWVHIFVKKLMYYEKPNTAPPEIGQRKDWSKLCELIFL